MIKRTVVPERERMDKFEIIGVICWIGLLIVLCLDLMGYLQ